MAAEVRSIVVDDTDTTQVQGLLSSGWAAQRTGRYVEAMDHYRTACDQCPDDQQAWLLRGKLADALGAQQEAAEALFHAAELCALRVMPAQAFKIASRVAELDPTHGGAQQLLTLLSNEHEDSAPTPANPTRRVIVSPSGEIRAASKSVRRKLATHAGRWDLWPSGHALIVLSRADEPTQAPTGERQLLLSGVINKPEITASVLQFVSANQWSGQLWIASESRRVFFFDRGKLVYGASDRPEDMLGATLVRLGHTTRPQVARCLSLPHSDRRIGEILVKEGVVSDAQLEAGVRHQTESIIFGALRSSHGSYHFMAPLDATRLPTRSDLKLQELVFDGMRRIDELAELRRTVPSALAIPQICDPAPTTSLPKATQALFDAIDAVRTLEQLTADLGVDEYTTTTATAQLLKAGFIRLTDPTCLPKHAACSQRK